jgi:PPOX class probable F420-dependent enzyme
MDDAEARRRFAAARVARLATIDEHGRPHIVPFVFVFDGGTIYSAVDEKPKTTRRLQRLRNIERNPNATALADHYEDDWSSAWWVRARGRARVIEPPDQEFSRAERLLAAKYAQYREAPPAGPVIAIDVDDWRGWAYEEGGPVHST